MNIKVNKKFIKNLSQQKPFPGNLTKNVNGGASVLPPELISNNSCGIVCMSQ